MSSFICPYCNHAFPVTNDTYASRFPSYQSDTKAKGYKGFDQAYDSEVSISFYRCPNCNEYTIIAQRTGTNVSSDDSFYIKPKSLAKRFPDYIPKAIREDYEEAYSILQLSPKASATLARRCLQGMIHDFWNIHEKNLNAEITSLKSLIPPMQWKVLDGIRSLGNIGAHMEHDINKIVDIDPEESVKLLKVIEKLISDWYINRYETEKLYEEVINISDEKQLQRKSNE